MYRRAPQRTPDLGLLPARRRRHRGDRHPHRAAKAYVAQHFGSFEEQKPEWLAFVKTPHARLHISRWFADREAPAVTIANKVRLGRLAIGLALRQRGRGLTSDLPLVRLLPRLEFPDLETLLVAVADHVRTADDVVDELIALVDHSPH